MLTKIPGSVAVYKEVPSVPVERELEPDPVISRFRHCG